MKRFAIFVGIVTIFGIVIGMAITIAIHYKLQNVRLETRVDALESQLSSTQKKLDARTKLEEDLYMGMKKSPEEVVVTYGRYLNYPLQLHLDNKSGGVSVRIEAPDTDTQVAWSDDTIKFLRNEVEKLVTKRDLIPLGKSGHWFHYTGGYPIWAPGHTLRGNHIHEISIFFAENGMLTSDGHIESMGRTNKIGYWPYEIAGLN